MQEYLCIVAKCLLSNYLLEELEIDMLTLLLAMQSEINKISWSDRLLSEHAIGTALSV